MDNYEVRVMLDGHYVIKKYVSDSEEGAKKNFLTYLESIGWENKEYEIFSINKVAAQTPIVYITDCDVDIKVRRLHDIAYNKYQLKWMLDHNHSIFDLVTELKDDAFEEYGFVETGADASEIVNDAFTKFLERGFLGNIFACRDEFLNAEYKDAAYMKDILSVEEFTEWQKEMKQLKIA